MDIQELLNRSRKELLDLSTRNRLLSVPVGSTSARIVQVLDELSEEVFRILINEKKSMTFLAGRVAKDTAHIAGTDIADGGDEVGLPQPEDVDEGSSGLAKRHIDSKLQTSLSSEGLQRRLLDLFIDSKTMVEEQGVNILYLALGHLKWIEADDPDSVRFAPLILIPVELERKTAAEKFCIKWREEDIEENLSLHAKLESDFGVKLPEFPNEEDFSPSKYFSAVEKAIAGAKGWEVLPNSITLGFFSFAKFLMYRDLDAKNWPTVDKLGKHPFITGLMQDGFTQSEPLFSEDVHLDELIPVEKLDHVVDADSSQSRAIEMVRQNRSMVIQGPPGTGKSQSITNLIASAILDGKKVLFVAEKLAALEVVKRRLEKEGLGALCLELHSNKSNKRAVIEEIGRTWKLGRPRASGLESLLPKLDGHRKTLNGHAESLHKPLPPCGASPFTIMGKLALLGDAGREVASLTFAGAEKWTVEAAAQAKAVMEDLGARVHRIGSPSEHPWRGVCKEAVLNIDLPPFETELQSALAHLQELRKVSESLATTLSQPVPTTLAGCEEQAIISEYVAQAPSVDKNALCNGVWNAGLEGLHDLLAEGHKFVAAKGKVGDRVAATTWDLDFSEARGHIAAHGQSFLRLLNGDYRRAVATVRGGLSAPLPSGFADRVALVDQIILGQHSLKGIQQGKGLGESAFGSFWRAEKTDWKQLDTVLDWIRRQRDVGLGASFREMFAGIEDQKRVAMLREDLLRKIAAFRVAANRVSAGLTLDWQRAFGVPDLETVPLEAAAKRFELWQSRLEDLIPWTNYFVRAKQAQELGLGSLVEMLETGKVRHENVGVCFDRIFFSQLLRHATRQDAMLARFDGELHENVVTDFKRLDKERLSLAKYRVLLAHHGGMPPHSGVGAAGIVKSEMERKRGHRTVRRLLKDAGSVVQAIKPVFMMSPLSVAQFLEPGAVEFDLLVIDEASQVQPVDALGAIARSKQIVVLGDSKQLPPTRFFMRLTSDTSEEDEEKQTAQIAEAKDIESILGLCCARGLPQTMLRWHYRSRHHSLIAVSNHQFYEDRLFIVPSPFLNGANSGLRFHHVPDGVFDAGASGTNRVEAKVICGAIVEHARNNPKQSLGVAAFSIRQRQAITDELELLRREKPELEQFFASHPTEPFFVKNLENVQGDERDVMFISVGYGRNSQGYLAMRFGPLSVEGGERRLNVLISRAKHKCDVFSSIMAEDIDLARASGRGVAALKTFLSYAQTGKLAVSAQSGLEEDSPFEEAVRKAIESLGYEVHPQVGIAGFFIDLGVVERANNGRYLLGIECDGAAYHSSRSARDRDRLRQAVLEDHGWLIHRIWSTDWFQRPNDQLRKVKEALERAKAVKADIAEAEAVTAKDEAEFLAETELEREPEAVISSNGLAELAVPYKEANFWVDLNQSPHELAPKQMADVLLRIIQEEGPIHEEELTNRVRDLWRLGRAGSRVQDAVAKGARSLLVTGKCTRADGFIQFPGVAVTIRNRDSVASANLRRPEMLPPTEIRTAIVSLVQKHHGATKREIPGVLARVFGFRVTTSHLRKIIDTQTKKLIASDILQETDGMLKPGQTVI